MLLCFSQHNFNGTCGGQPRRTRTGRVKCEAVPCRRAFLVAAAVALLLGTLTGAAAALPTLSYTGAPWIQAGRCELAAQRLASCAAIHQRAIMCRKGSVGVVVLESRSCCYQAGATSSLSCAPCRGTSLIRNSAPLAPYSRNMPRALWWSWGGLLFLMSEVPLYPP